ncbi:MAG: alpha/beta hydrolase-fold protein [Planctomycetota bacterium]
MLIATLSLLLPLQLQDPADLGPHRSEQAIPGQPYERYGTRDDLGRRIEFYLTQGSARLPLAVYIQGSGCASHFGARGARVVGRTGHDTVADAFAGRAHVLLVEKPGVAYLDDGTEASAPFRAEHTLDRWCTAIAAALRAARQLPQVADDRTLVIGHSEGGLVACKLAADRREVTHVASLAGGGVTQLFDLILLARAGHVYRGAADDPAGRERRLIRDWRRVLADPDNTDRLFLGHSHRRWTSFLATSPVQQLQATDARIFIAQGGADHAVAPMSFEVLRAQLLAWGKDVRARLVDGADHSFARDGANGWREIMTDVRDWYLDA